MTDERALVHRRNQREWEVRGRFLVENMRSWRHRILHQMWVAQQDGDEVELDLLTIELVEFWYFMSTIQGSVEMIDEVRKDERQ